MQIRKFLLTGLSLLTLATPLKVHAENSTTIKLPGNQWRVGLDTIFAGRMERSANGAPKYLYGITAGLGFGFRYYINTKDELQTVHLYGEAGTTSIIYPYIGGGIEYDLPVGDDITGQTGAFSIGGGAYLFSRFFGAETIFVPTVSVSYSFR